MDRLTELLIRAADPTVPANKFTPHLKPEWSPELKRAQASSKSAYKAWVRVGRPRSPTNLFHTRYKECKSIFRRIWRNHLSAQRDKFFQELDLSCSDPRKIFQKVRRARGGALEPTTTLSLDGHSFSGDELPDAWASYFENLASLPTDDFGADHNQLISDQFAALAQDSCSEFVPFTVDEVSEATKSLSLGKAAGPDDIDAEHLVYGGELLLEHLTVLFNAIVTSGTVPSAFRCGLVIPLPKDTKIRTCLFLPTTMASPSSPI